MSAPMTNQQMLRELRLLRILQTLDAPSTGPGRTWAPMVDALHELAQEPADTTVRPRLPLPLPEEATPIEDALGVPQATWRILVRQAHETNAHGELGAHARAVMQYANLPAHHRYDAPPDPPDLMPVVAALKALPVDGHPDVSALRDSLNALPLRHRGAHLFDCGTLAHLAARSCGQQALVALFDAGFDFTARNHQGQTPLDVAREHGNRLALSSSVLTPPCAALPMDRTQQDLTAGVLPVLGRVAALPELSSSLTGADWHRRLLDGAVTSFVEAGLLLTLATAHFKDDRNTTVQQFPALEGAGGCWFLCEQPDGTLGARHARNLLEAGAIMEHALSVQGLGLTWHRHLPLPSPRTIANSGLGVMEAYQVAQHALRAHMAHHQAQVMDEETPQVLPRKGRGPSRL